MQRAAALLGLALMLAGVGAGQGADRGVAQFTENEERFQLFNSCRPMFFVVDGINDEVEGIGLTKEVLLPAIESRLRAARLYPDAPEDEAGRALLVANVNVVHSAFHVSIAYAKRVTDEFGANSFADTWSRGMTGTHARNAQYVMSSLLLLLDQFLAGYLRINAEACR